MDRREFLKIVVRSAAISRLALDTLEASVFTVQFKQHLATPAQVEECDSPT